MVTTGEQEQGGRREHQENSKEGAFKEPANQIHCDNVHHDSLAGVKQGGKAEYRSLREELWRTRIAGPSLHQAVHHLDLSISTKDADTGPASKYYLLMIKRRGSVVDTDFPTRQVSLYEGNRRPMVCMRAACRTLMFSHDTIFTRDVRKSSQRDVDKYFR